eukprot:XP_027302877.1 striatin-4 [Anas platyrhynchos]
MAAERAAAAGTGTGAAPRAQPPPPPGPGPGSGPVEAANRGGLSLPGILHFIQHEWARFEAEKGRWEAERAELQAQVAFLQGERKGQENLKTDLVRRIKMLEYALKQERSKYHKLKFGTEPAPGDKKPEALEPAPNGPLEVAALEGGPLAWKEGRQLLRHPPKPLLPEVEDEDDDDDSEDALNEFDFLGSGENGDGRRAGEGGGELESRRVRLQGMLADLRDVDGLPPKTAASGQPRAHEGSLGLSSDVFIMDSIGGGAVSLGDLADLTVTNDNELSCDLSEGRDALKKTWNPKFTLRSHYDAVRGLAFHPAEAALLTASEDSTLKLWNLQKTVAAKKNAALDVEPVYAFRGHRWGKEPT